MAFQDFLEGFAKAQGVESVDALLTQYADKYSFQIRSRERAADFIAMMQSLTGFQFPGKEVLDIGCAYGSYSIEMARHGAHATGVDVTEKWLRLAELNAKADANVRFVLCDASSRTALTELESGRYELIVLNDVLEHVYDTVGLLHNCRELLVDGGLIYFKVPNGKATRNVLREGHKKEFGIALLPPDYWHEFVKAPFSIYYRRLEFFQSLFDRFDLPIKTWVTTNRDPNVSVTRRKILQDKARISELLAPGNFASKKQFDYLRNAIGYYFEEMDEDLAALPEVELYLKYRATFWEGILEKRTSDQWPADNGLALKKPTMLSRLRKSVRSVARLARRRFNPRSQVG